MKEYSQGRSREEIYRPKTRPQRPISELTSRQPVAERKLGQTPQQSIDAMARHNDAAIEQARVAEVNLDARQRATLALGRLFRGEIFELDADQMSTITEHSPEILGDALLQSDVKISDTTTALFSVIQKSIAARAANPDMAKQPFSVEDEA